MYADQLFGEFVKNSGLTISEETSKGFLEKLRTLEVPKELETIGNQFITVDGAKGHQQVNDFYAAKFYDKTDKALEESLKENGWTEEQIKASKTGLRTVEWIKKAIQEVNASFKAKITEIENSKAGGTEESKAKIKELTEKINEVNQFALTEKEKIKAEKDAEIQELKTQLSTIEQSMLFKEILGNFSLIKMDGIKTLVELDFQNVERELKGKIRVDDTGVPSIYDINAADIKVHIDNKPVDLIAYLKKRYESKGWLYVDTNAQNNNGTTRQGDPNTQVLGNVNAKYVQK